MILFDTNVLIDFWRKPEELLKFKKTSEKFAICGPVKTELLHSSKNDDEIDKMLNFFTTFELIPLDEYDFEFAGIMLNTLKHRGFALPVMDVLIAYTAIKHNIPLWTKDSHFKHIQALYP